ncbi:MAG: tetratricopeptide repeat protein [Deltaproteobacteria bacterium]|nr:tetratricopeptide repeat protein [Deltaproteobacteria bacterium]
MKLLLLLFLFPANAWASNPVAEFKGNRSYEKGDYAAATKEFEKAQNHYNLGDSLYKEGKFAEAGPHFLASLNSDDPALRQMAMYNLGNTKYRQQDLQGAVDAYNQVLEWNPQNEKARKNRDFVLEQMKKNPPPPPQEEKKEEEKKEPEEQKKPEEQQPDQNQENQKPEEKPAQPEKGEEVGKKEAERILGSIEDDPKEPMKEMIRQEASGKKVPPGKDW